jgi:type II secretory pathway component PulJ
MAGRGHARPRPSGFSYVEVMVAAMILALCLPAALQALGSAVRAADTQPGYTVNQQRLGSRIEVVLANRYATLDAAAIAAGNSPSAIVAAYSDAAGTADRLIVNLYRYDGAAPSASDTGLLRVKVSIEGSALALETLKAR